MSRNARLPIIVYHSLDTLGTRVSTHPDTFRQHMKWLSDHCWQTIHLGEATRRILAGEPISPRTAVISFDDAMVSVRDIADPILQEYGFCATTFAITGQVGQKPIWYRLPEPYLETPLLSVDELGRLAEGVWEIQPHTHDHPVLKHLPYDLQVEQIARSRDLVREWFGTPADVLAYPFGQINEDTARAMKACEMAAGVTLAFSTRLPVDDPFHWPRMGSAWFKKSDFRQQLALRGWLEHYVAARGLVKKGKAQYFLEVTAETTRYLLPGGERKSEKEK